MDLALKSLKEGNYDIAAIHASKAHNLYSSEESQKLTDKVKSAIAEARKMEADKREAKQLMDLALKSLKEGNYDIAATHASKAHNLYSSEESKKLTDKVKSAIAEARKMEADK